MASDPTHLQSPSEPDGTHAPSVLIVLVVRNGAAWLPGSLEAIAAQTYPRLGVIAVDCASTDTSGDVLVHALDEERVIRLPTDAGLSGAVQAALKDERAQGADYILTVHDDAALSAEAVERLIEAAEGLEIEDVGIVGSKIVDWDQPRLLRDVGSSSDRFGHPYSPLEPHELDHGQHDRVREVLWVSSAGMLVSQAAWRTIGFPDERLGSSSEDLDFCWRARIAGLRVVWTPLSVVRHVGASARALRPGEPARPHRRYDEERAAVAALLKNYRFISLLWILPLYLLQGVAKVIGLFVSRRFDEARQVLAAWFWNLFHLPGTFGRRFRVQRARSARDRQVHRYMVPGSIRLRRWFEAVARIVPGDVDVPDDDDQEVAVPLRTMAGSAIRQHPAAAAWLAALFIGFFATKHLWGTGPLSGGVIPAMPSSSADLFGELFSGVRTTALGGVQAASPALAILGSLSWATVGNPNIAERLMLAALPLFVAVSTYRYLVRTVGTRVPAIGGAALYTLSALSFWAFSQGRIDFLVALAILPRVANRIGIALGPGTPKNRIRFMVGTGAFLAVGMAFWPGIVLAAAVMFVAYLVAPEERRRRAPGIALVVGVLIAGALLVFPLVVDLVRAGGDGLGVRVGESGVAGLLRLVPGPATGDWALAWLLPALALLGFALADRERRQPALRFLIAALGGLGLAWASAAGWLPKQVSNVPAYLAVAALGYAALATIGLACVFGKIRSFPLGLRRLFAAGFMLALIVFLLFQSLLAATGNWAVGDNRLPAAWPIIAAGTPPGYRLLWLSHRPGLPFPAPGGDAAGVADDGTNTLWYAITDRQGVSSLDIGRGDSGDGYEAAVRTIAELQTGSTRHLGGLLAPFGIRYIVAAPNELPASVRARLADQVDLDRIPAGGLEVYRTDKAFPDAAVITDETFAAARTGGDATSIASLSLSGLKPLVRSGSGWNGTSEGRGDVWIGEQSAPGWVLHVGTGSEATFVPALGWAMSAPVPDPGAFTVRYEDGSIRLIEMVVLGLLWLAVMWITRKPARR